MIEEVLYGTYDLTSTCTVSTDTAFTLEKLNETIKMLDEKIPSWSCKELDEAIAAGVKINNLALIIPLKYDSGMKNIKTPYGWLKIQYSDWISDFEAFLVNCEPYSIKAL